MTTHSAPPAPPDLKLNQPAEPAGPQKMPGIESIISANPACALAAEGRRVGLNAIPPN